MSNFIKHLFQDKYQQQQTHICLPGVATWLADLTVLLFPLMGQRYFESEASLLEALDDNRELLITILNCQPDSPEQCPEQAVDAFYEQLEHVESKLNRDADFFFANDPACSSVSEVIAAYPGFFAVCCYRIAHQLFRLGYPLVARMVTENAHSKTGVDIHPGAHIGCPFFIDHATGVVIGETTRVGDRVIIYQGVTLGALRVAKQLHGTKRHPTVEDDCIIYANATILGGDTVIGEKSIIGGNVWLAQSVKPNSSVYHESIMTTKDRDRD